MEKEHEGIQCPNPACQVVGKYTQVGNAKKGTDVLTRTKSCKNCGTQFTTIEVPVGTVSVA